MPEDAFLRRYADSGNSYTDCYATELESNLRLDEYIVAFYTSPVFKLERFVLSTVFGKPSTDSQARELALDERDTFAAWHVEGRDTKQILLCDFRGRTRSWLMVETLVDGKSSRLYFGSAVVFPPSGPEKSSRPSRAFRILLRFHQLYSRILLWVTRRSLVA